jgi:hypothetical protein
VMAPNGTLITPENAREMKASGIQRCSISIDAPSAGHDAFRGVPGAFDKALRGIGYLKDARCGVSDQTHVTGATWSSSRTFFIWRGAWRGGAHLLLVPTAGGRNSEPRSFRPGNTMRCSTGSTISARPPDAPQSHLRAALLPDHAPAGQGRGVAVTRTPSAWTP